MVIAGAPPPTRTIERIETELGQALPAVAQAGGDVVVQAPVAAAQPCQVVEIDHAGLVAAIEASAR